MPTTAKTRLTWQLAGALVAAAAFAFGAHCAGDHAIYVGLGDSGSVGGGGGGGGDGGSDAGDGGSDAGDGGSDAGDGGSQGDGGCRPFSAVLGAIDGCVNGLVGSATVSIDNACVASIYDTASGTSCAGRASGPANAFDGGCSIGPGACVSSSLPGTIVCSTSMSSSCTIVICDAGTCH